MQKTITRTIKEDAYYCDVCGKKLTKKEIEQCVSWATLHYGRMYNGKNCTDEFDEFTVKLDLCNICNNKLSDIVLKSWYEFKEKFENEELLIEKIRKE